MPLNEFAPNLKINGCFIVKNTANPTKTLFIFNYPIPSNMSRDLLAIKGVSESDIRSSLLKGELNHKIRSKDIMIECSDIDLLQFNINHKIFLQSSGIINGLQVSSSNLDVLHKEDVQLVGTVDGTNATFYIPDNSFIYNSIYKIIVYKNGVKQVLGDDYTIFESSGPGTGYDGILFSVSPTIIPTPDDIMTADYYIGNI